MAGGGSDLFIDQVGRPDQASRPPEKRNTGASFVKLTLLLRRAALRQWSSSYQQHAQTAMISSNCLPEATQKRRFLKIK